MSRERRAQRIYKQNTSSKREKCQRALHLISALLCAILWLDLYKCHEWGYLDSSLIMFVASHLVHHDLSRWLSLCAHTGSSFSLLNLLSEIIAVTEVNCGYHTRLCVLALFVCFWFCLCCFWWNVASDFECLHFEYFFILTTKDNNDSDDDKDQLWMDKSQLEW